MQRRTPGILHMAHYHYLGVSTRAASALDSSLIVCQNNFSYLVDREQRSRPYSDGARAQHGSNECIIIIDAAPVAERPTHRNLMASAGPPRRYQQKTN